MWVQQNTYHKDWLFLILAIENWSQNDKPANKWDCRDREYDKHK